MRLPLVLSVVGLFVLPVGVNAAPLDATVCDGAKSEQSALDDVPPILERGPDWAKTHIDAGVLKRVQRWIELQEMLSFRCGRGPLTAQAQRAAAAAELIENPPPTAPVAQAPPSASAPATAAPPVAAAQPAAGDAAPAPKPKPKVKAKPKSSAAALGNAAPAEAGDPPPPKKKRPPKADAFVPPPSSAASPAESP